MQDAGQESMAFWISSSEAPVGLTTLALPASASNWKTPGTSSQQVSQPMQSSSSMVTVPAMGAKMPAVLVEMGYITNKTEAARLKSDAYLRRLADGIANGVGEYKQQIERFTTRR